MRRAVKIAPVAALQSDYSPFVLEIEGPSGTNLLKTCRELGVAMVAAMPLGRGLLTNTFADGQPVGDSKDARPNMMPRFMGENREKNVKIVAEFRKLAEARNCTPSQLALAWLLKQGNDVFPIPGTKQIKYLEENWAAQAIVLKDEDVAEIRYFLEHVDIAGGVLPPQFAEYTYRDTVEEGSNTV